MVDAATAAGQALHPDHQLGQALPLRPPAPPYRLWEEAGTTCSHGGPALGTPHLWVALAWLATFPVPGVVGTFFGILALGGVRWHQYIPFYTPPSPQMAGYCLTCVLFRGLRGAPVWGWEDEQGQSLPL